MGNPEMPTNRRDVLRSLGTGTALVVGGTGVAAGNPFDDDPEENAEVRVLHASPDTPAVDVFVDGAKVVNGITFKTITDYLPLPPGEYDVAVAPAGAGVENAVIGPLTLTLEADTDYTVAARNRFANITAQVFVDDNDVEFFETDARLRVVHLSPDAPGIDVVQTDGFGVVFDPEVVVGGLTFGNATGYLELLPTDYEYEIRPAGGDEAVFDFEYDPDVGVTNTAFAVGLLDPDTEDQAFDVVLSEDVPSLPDRVGRDDGDREDEDDEDDEEDGDEDDDDDSPGFDH